MERKAGYAVLKIPLKMSCNNVLKLISPTPKALWYCTFIFKWENAVHVLLCVYREAMSWARPVSERDVVSLVLHLRKAQGSLVQVPHEMSTGTWFSTRHWRLRKTRRLCPGRRRHLITFITVLLLLTNSCLLQRCKRILRLGHLHVSISIYRHMYINIIISLLLHITDTE